MILGFGNEYLSIYYIYINLYFAQRPQWCCCYWREEELHRDKTASLSLALRSDVTSAAAAAAAATRAQKILRKCKQQQLSPALCYSFHGWFANSMPVAKQFSSFPRVSWRTIHVEKSVFQVSEFHRKLKQMEKWKCRDSWAAPRKTDVPAENNTPLILSGV